MERGCRFWALGGLWCHLRRKDRYMRWLMGHRYFGGLGRKRHLPSLMSLLQGPRPPLIIPGMHRYLRSRGSSSLLGGALWLLHHGLTNIEMVLNVRDVLSTCSSLNTLS